MVKRIRVKQTLSFRDRLAYFAEQWRKAASELPPGPDKDEMLQKAAHADTASTIDEWANSPGLQPPK